MVRFVLGPQNEVVPDLKRRLPGRGVWIDATHQSVAGAVKKRAFSRAFRQEARAPETLADDVAALMARAALERLAIANKAGHVLAGYEKVRALIEADGASGLVTACDAAADGRAKGEALAKKAARRHNEVWRVELFSSADLERSLGRERVVHVALTPGRPSELFFKDAKRLAGFAFGMPLAQEHTETQPDEPRFAGPLSI